MRLAVQLSAFVGGYSAIFSALPRFSLQRAREYVCGLLVADKGTMQRMEEAVSGSDEQALQHFMARSAWDERAVVRQVGQDVDRLLGGQGDSCLILDETGLPKKGEQSVGVARQWCGQVGKVDSCQVAVFAVMNRGTRAAPVDVRLYLPREWTDDRKRCRKAGIPAADMRLRTKHELALEIVESARTNGLRYRWVGCDAFYGKNPMFLRALQQRGETFVADVHKNQVVYLEDPSRPAAQVRGIRVDDWVAHRPETAWRRVAVRDTTKAELQVEILHQVVWLWDGNEAVAHQWRLLVRREIASPEKIKYVLSNAGSGVDARRLAFMQAQRYWVERSFQDAKAQAGLGDYQVRGWKPWHRHMALVLMAMAFLLQARLGHESDYPLLSCRDVTAVLKQSIRAQQMTPEALIRQLEKRHRQRQQSVSSAAYRRQPPPLTNG